MLTTRQMHEGRISLAAGDTASARAVLKALGGVLAQ
jgi:hypothetical protein